MPDRYATLLREDSYAGYPPMNVWLYANTPAEREAVRPGPTDDHVVEALRAVLSDLFDYGPVGAVGLYGFDHGAVGHYPEVEGGSYYAYREEFGSFLTERLGVSVGAGGPDERPGVHLLLHGNGCTVDHASAHPAGDSYYENAFGLTATAWSGLNCRDEDLERASAVQETLHPFVNYNNVGVQEILGDPDAGHLAEHALGKVEDGAVTPMLTYHVDDDTDYASMGRCDGESDGEADTWTASPTDCTRDAVCHTADEYVYGSDWTPEE